MGASATAQTPTIRSLVSIIEAGDLSGEYLNSLSGSVEMAARQHIVSSPYVEMLK
jgi:hypothetical protein